VKQFIKTVASNWIVKGESSQKFRK